MIDAHVHWLHEMKYTQDGLDTLEKKLKAAGISEALIYLIDKEDYLKETYRLNFGSFFIPGIAPDMKSDGIYDILENISQAGVKIIKILPLDHHIFREDYARIVEISKTIESLGMCISICCAYGTEDYYRTNGVELAAEVLKSGFKNPLILAHGGMMKWADVISLWEIYSNIYLDFSFTLPFWWGSSVIQDYYFVFRKFNFERIFYGSDYPYISNENAIGYFSRFCEKYEIDDERRYKLTDGNFMKFKKDFLKYGI